jgi:DNA-nicking Smr family endonuclease
MTIKHDNDNELTVGEEAPIIMPIDGVLDLHTFLPRELNNLIDDYIDACVKAGVFELRIIHGKGKGILKKRVYSILARNKTVQGYSQAAEDAGGWGAVLVKLKRG